jgi:hypothetical protein
MDEFIQAFEAGVDVTLLRENLKLTPQQRFDKFDAFMRNVVAMREFGEKHRQKQRQERDENTSDRPTK